jgi:hypothetical protein
MRRGSAPTIAGLSLYFAVLVFGFPSASAEGPFAIAPSTIVERTLGHNSLPGAVLRDGTVCRTADVHSLTCQPLMRISPEIVKRFEEDTGFFDGIFDVDKCGSPEIFFDYWPERDDPNCPAKYRDKSDPRCDVIALFVYRKLGDTYRKVATLNAPTMGYSPDAWFINDSPMPKAVFMTRYGGSSGDGLFYLNWKKRALELISDDYYIGGAPLIEDFDGEGHSEIFITARGYDRTAKQGAALLRWKNDGYQLWWPTWTAPPYIMYAQPVTFRDSKTPVIVAVVDPQSREIDDPRGDMESQRRELTVWQLAGDTWQMIASKEIDGVANPSRMCAFPELTRVTSTVDGAAITLTYEDGGVTTCQFKGRDLSCHKQISASANPAAPSK